MKIILKDYNTQIISPHYPDNYEITVRFVAAELKQLPTFDCIERLIKEGMEKCQSQLKSAI